MAVALRIVLTTDATASAALASLDPDPHAAGCTLTAPASDLSASDKCLDCHRALGTASSHPVKVDYQNAQWRSRGSLRPMDAVVKRGVFLPEGVVQCTTCHDARSPWAHHIALPPGSVARPAVNPRKRETYENRSNWRVPSQGAQPQLAPGAAVSPAPLCAACHTVAD
jgi:hypothetical protein